MREELIIDGQQVDLGSETSITLEYVSNLLNDPGKISLSHSYTLKLPRTANNARILDLPEIPAHDSSKTRRYLPALYLRNGINLIGDDAHAYITSATDEQYELVLVWDDIPELRALAESDATINDLPGLPVLTWIGNSYGVLDNGALFAKYTSSNQPKDTDNVNNLIHPCMLARDLLSRTLSESGVNYDLPSESLQDLVVLAAPSHRPDNSMNIAAGLHLMVDKTSERLPFYQYAGGDIAVLVAQQGLQAQSGVDVLFDNISCQFHLRNDKNTCCILLRVFLEPDNDFNWDRCTFQALPRKSSGGLAQEIVLAEAPIVRVPNGFICVGELAVTLPEGYDTFGLAIRFPNDYKTDVGAYVTGFDCPTPIVVYTEHDAIITSISNEFPLGGNLPDLTQWDFVRNMIVLGGLSPNVHAGVLHLVPIRQVLDVSQACDWSTKLNMANSVSVKPRLSGDWAQSNALVFAENPEFTTNQGFNFHVADTTLKTTREWISLDFAPSLKTVAIHYKTTDEGATYEDVDIEPRFFQYDAETKSLQFTPDLYGEGLKAKYAALQAALEKPVVIEATVRLTEIDLATLDLTSPVYLAQFGRYYHVLKVQTGKTDDCKVELLQLR